MDPGPTEILYSKQLTQSDAACSKQIKLPRNEAKKFVGDLRHKQSAALVVKDVNGTYWEFICTCYGCQYALSKVGGFAKAFNLKPGDTLSFYRDTDYELRIAVNRTVPSPLQPRVSHGTRRKRGPCSDEQPAAKHIKCTGLSTDAPVSPVSTCHSLQSAQDGIDQHTSAFSRLPFPGVFSSSGSCPSSPGGTVWPRHLARFDAVRSCADAQSSWDGVHNLQAVLLLQTMESLNSGPALFKASAPADPVPVQRSLSVDLHLAPLQVPDCLSPAKQVQSRFCQDCSNVSEDTLGRLDVLEDSSAGCSTPEASPTSTRRLVTTVALSKQLSRMDVRCAHDSVGITLTWDEVIASQLMDATYSAVKCFNVVDQQLGTVYPCSLTRSVDGRFCYLTGLGPFLNIHSAQPGQSLSMATSCNGTLTITMQP